MSITALSLVVEGEHVKFHAGAHFCIHGRAGDCDDCRGLLSGAAFYDSRRDTSHEVVRLHVTHGTHGYIKVAADDETCVHGRDVRRQGCHRCTDYLERGGHDTDDVTLRLFLYHGYLVWGGDTTCLHGKNVGLGCADCVHQHGRLLDIQAAAGAVSATDLKHHQDFVATGRPAVTAGCNDGPSDDVLHPDHYTGHPSGVECWDVAQHFNFNLGNVFKYVWRAGKKDTSLVGELQDLEKADQYLQHEIERVSGIINQTLVRKP